MRVIKEMEENVRKEGRGYEKRSIRNVLLHLLSFSLSLFISFSLFLFLSLFLSLSIVHHEPLVVCQRKPKRSSKPALRSRVFFFFIFLVLSSTSFLFSAPTLKNVASFTLLCSSCLVLFISSPADAVAIFCFVLVFYSVTFGSVTHLLFSLYK